MTEFMPIEVEIERLEWKLAKLITDAHSYRYYSKSLGLALQIADCEKALATFRALKFNGNIGN